MKSIFSTFAFMLLLVSIGNTSSNPWDLEKLRIDQIVELKNIQFEMDESILTSDSEQALLDFAAFLKENKSVKIELRGHTNSIPPHEYCDKLSENRANAVRLFLVNEGISANRINAKGYGKRMPISSNSSKEGRASNQRVDVKFLAL